MQKTSYQPWIRILIILLITLASISVAVTTVEAAGGDDDGIIEEDEIIQDDIFLNAETVRMDGTVEGNVIANGNTILINGTITGDAFLFASEVYIGEDAVIEGNLFSGAQSIYVAGQIDGSIAAGSSLLVLQSEASLKRNLYYGGFSLEIEEGSTIGVDLYSGNYQMIMNGSVGRDINAGAAAVVINGVVERNVNLDLGDPQNSMITFPVPAGVSETIQPGLRIGESAAIGGDINYTSTVDQIAKIQSEPEGEIVFQTPVPGEARDVTAPQQGERDGIYWVFGRFIANTLKTFWENFISLLAVGAVLVFLLPGLFKHTVVQLRREPLASAGFGILTVILGYISLFLAAVAVLVVSLLLTIISAGGLGTATFGFGFASLGLISTVFTMLVIYASKIIVSYLAGSWILSKLAPASRTAENPFWGMALGVLIYSILRVIPVFGWLLAFIVIILGMGAFWLAYRNRRMPPGSTQSALQLETPTE